MLILLPIILTIFCFFKALSSDRVYGGFVGWLAAIGYIWAIYFAFTMIPLH